MRTTIRKIIREQIDLFFETFEMNNDKKKFTPTNEVSKTAQIALNSIGIAKQNGIQVQSIDVEGNQGSGILKAKQLSQKIQQSFAEMKKLKSFFKTNAQNVEEERKKIGIIQQKKGTSDEMSKSNILLVWNLHGGDVGKKWIESVLLDAHKQGNKKKERLRKIGGAYKNNGMGVFKTQFNPSQQRINK